MLLVVDINASLKLGDKDLIAAYLGEIAAPSDLDAIGERRGHIGEELAHLGAAA